MAPVCSYAQGIKTTQTALRSAYEGFGDNVLPALYVCDGLDVCGCHFTDQQLEIGQKCPTVKCDGVIREAEGIEYSPEPVFAL